MIGIDFVLSSIDVVVSGDHSAGGQKVLEDICNPGVIYDLIVF